MPLQGSTLRHRAELPTSRQGAGQNLCPQRWGVLPFLISPFITKGSPPLGSVLAPVPGAGVGPGHSPNEWGAQPDPPQQEGDRAYCPIAAIRRHHRDLWALLPLPG